MSKVNAEDEALTTALQLMKRELNEAMVLAGNPHPYSRAYRETMLKVAIGHSYRGGYNQALADAIELCNDNRITSPVTIKAALEAKAL